MPLLKKDIYTVEDIYALPAGQRAELIDGQIYNMAPPSYLHQRLVMELSATIRDYIKSRTTDVREYWIVNPMTQTIQTYFFGDPEDFHQYSFPDEITVGIYDNLNICISDLLK